MIDTETTPTQQPPGRMSRRRFVALTSAAGVALAVPTGAQPAAADGRSNAVLAWIVRNASKLRTVDPATGLRDLRPLREIVADTQVVGLGESTHGAGDVFRIKHRAARFLVENAGFRTIAFEEDWAGGVAIDRYIRTGAGDPVALISQASPIWRTQEMFDLISWMRSFNDAHCGELRFVGTDLTQLRQLSFDEITAYIACAAPERLEELADLVLPIAPGVRGPTEQIIWYFQQPDPQPYIDAARATLDFVQGNRADGCQPSHYDALQHARAVLGWYEFHGLGHQRGPRDLFMADNVTDWQQRTGHHVIYWAANVHTAANPRVTFTVPPDPTMTEVMTGSHLRARYGRRYVSIGTIFHEGTIITGWSQPEGPRPHVVGPPHPTTVDATLGDAILDDYLINLHAPAGRPVRQWLDAPAALRLIAAEYDAADDLAHIMTVDSLSGGFDALLHLAHTTPTQLLDQNVPSSDI